MKIVIDARLYGPKNTGNGRYTQSLIENLTQIDNKNTYYILLRSVDFGKVSLPDNFIKIKADFPHYSFSEQFRLPFILGKIKPDVVHFPHFNIPILYFGKYIVTIHDLIMHKFTGLNSTTKSFLVYLFFRVGYYISFAKAVYGSTKIIAPSNFVKDEILRYYKVNPKKINVVYE